MRHACSVCIGQPNSLDNTSDNDGALLARRGARQRNASRTPHGNRDLLARTASWTPASLLGRSVHLAFGANVVHAGAAHRRHSGRVSHEIRDPLERAATPVAGDDGVALAIPLNERQREAIEPGLHAVPRTRRRRRSRTRYFFHSWTTFWAAYRSNSLSEFSSRYGVEHRSGDLLAPASNSAPKLPI